MGSIWDANGTAVPAAGDFLIAIYFALGIGGMMFLLDAFVYQKLAIRVLCSGVALSKIDDARRAKVVKFRESMWKLTYFSMVVFWALKIIYHEPWSRDTIDYFRGWPKQELKFSLKNFYMFQFGLYIYSIAALLTWETRRKDFSIMMSHHIVTTILIGYSYISRLFRIGTIILALHDSCDIFLEAAKILKYSEIEMGASICFGLFALSWFLLRLIFFPFWIIKASSYHSLEFLSVADSFIAMYYVFNTMLLTLLIFHTYWWVLICSMIRRQLKNSGKVGEDIRSDSEDDD